MKTEYEHMMFVMQERKKGAKTDAYFIRNKKSGDLLGGIKWYGPWRKYCFFPAGAHVVFDWRCLGHIRDFIDDRMKERRKRGRKS